MHATRPRSQTSTNTKTLAAVSERDASDLDLDMETVWVVDLASRRIVRRTVADSPESLRRGA